MQRFWYQLLYAYAAKVEPGSWFCQCRILSFNTLRPRQNGCHFPDYIFKYIFLNENVWISIEMSPKFVSKGPINNIPTLVPIMAWRRPGAKPLSETMMVRLLTHICVIRPQWVKSFISLLCISAVASFCMRLLYHFKYYFWWRFWNTRHTFDPRSSLYQVPLYSC